jgi:hypothetical protein
VVRTDYSDDNAWRALRAALDIGGAEDLNWPLLVVDGVEWAGASVDEVLDAAGGDTCLDVVFIADRAALIDPEHKLLAVATGTDSPRQFRVVPSWVILLHGTLAATDVRFDVFAKAAAEDPEGAFRGFAD